MGSGRRRKNATRTWTWCCIGFFGSVAIAALIVSIAAYRGVRQMQQQAPGKFGARNGEDRFMMPQRNLVIGVEDQPRGRSGRSGRSFNQETEEVGAIFFGDQASIMVESDGIESTMSLDLNTNATDFLKSNGPPCGGAPTLTIDPRKNECPRGFVGINNKNPQCNLHVNETMCVEGETLFSGNVTIDGILFVNNLVGLNVTVVQCNNDVDCDDLNDCTIDQCNSNFCEYSLVGECAHSNDCSGNAVCSSFCNCTAFVSVECTTNFDCDDSNPCTDDDCSQFGTCKHFPVLNCCEFGGDCDDYNDCTQNNCVGNVCQFPVIPGGECAHSNDCSGNSVCGENCSCVEFVKTECELNSDCNDSDSCTEDLCIHNICNNRPIPDCCTTNFDCLDFNDCTIDNCVNGLCRNEQIPSCCTFDQTCDDFNDCTVDSCGEENSCNFTLIGECAHSSDCPGNSVCSSFCNCTKFVPACLSDSDCDDSDSCTIDKCEGELCVNQVPVGECNLDHFCTSNEFCNTTTCKCELACNQSECNAFPCEVHTCVDGECVFLHEDVNCCTSNADCDDGNACAVKFCNLITGQCMPMPSLGCSFDSDCGSGQVCDSNCTCVDICPLTVCNFTDFGNQFELPSNPLDNDFFSAGFSLSVNNDKMIVGAPGQEIRGAAIILSRYADNIWIEEAFLTFLFSELNDTDTFGTEVKIHNDIAIVLCPGCGFISLLPVLIYEFDGNWTAVDALSLSTGFDEYTIDLLDEKILLTGNNLTSSTSTILIYDRNQTSGLWELTQEIGEFFEITDSAFDKADVDYFVVGGRHAFFADGDTILYCYNGTQYNKVASFVLDTTLSSSEDNLGASVDFHNGIVVVGSPSPGGIDFVENIFVFSTSGSNVTFLQIVRPRHLNALSFTECGTSVAIHDDIIVVGCINERVNDNNIGAANVFKLIGDEYRWISRMTAPAIENLFPSTFYGHSVDIDGTTIAIGAPRSDIAHSGDGNVYINRCTELKVCQ